MRPNKRMRLTSQRRPLTKYHGQRARLKRQNARPTYVRPQGGGCLCEFNLEASG